MEQTSQNEVCVCVCVCLRVHASRACALYESREAIRMVNALS